jgi:hypothetical protein
MLNSWNKQQINYHYSHLNADSGFDVKKIIEYIGNNKIITNIKENKQNSRKVTIELCFWLDTHKRLLIKFEVISKNFKTYMQIASAMINFRHVFN